VNLRLYNTQTGRKERFEPSKEGQVGMYVCGPTVYDRAHIGNARPVVVFDLLYRLLKRLYPKVTYVRNITDVDDKINAAAKENDEPIQALTERTTKDFHDDIAELNALPPDEEPRATEHIEEMKELVEKLLAAGHAYEAEGHVLFHVPSDPGYGKLSHRDREEMIAGARVEVASYKKDPADFVLWKPSTPDLPGWESPWGRGRPGWHLECSTMSRYYLGETVDIHGGGLDLVFPHHENEIAQSECAYGKPFVRYWIHNGYLTVDGEKMSKSLGNFITIREALDRAPGRGETIRYLMLNTHYRHPLDWSDDAIQRAKTNLDRLYTALHGASDIDGSPDGEIPSEVMAALEDDLNTSLALSSLHQLAGELNKTDDPARKRELKTALLSTGSLLGLLNQDPAKWRRGMGRVIERHHVDGLPIDDSAASDVEEMWIEEQITKRREARKAKDFAAADARRG
jgi:cysteinyl-tRNA synthetase